MYTFEGDFRRKPEQNLAGASRRSQQRDQLLQRAQHERLKREEVRKRFKSTVVIQAFLRGCLVRIQSKNLQRLEFDHLCKTNTTETATLEILIKKILFFYNKEVDSNRLVFICQLVLKLRDCLLQWAATSSSSSSGEVRSIWSVRLSRLLALCLTQLVHLVQVDSRESPAILLRTLEVFTCWDQSIGALDRDRAKHYLVPMYAYLLDKGYFDQVRCLIEARVPPMVEPTAHAPTPLAGCLFEMINRPLKLISQCEPCDRFNRKVLRSLCQHLLSPRISSPLKLYILPALCESSDFSFGQMLDALMDSRQLSERNPSLFIPHTIWMLYSFLSLEHSYVGNTSSTFLVLSYLESLSSLTENLVRQSVKQNEKNSEENIDEDSSDLSEIQSHITEEQRSIADAELQIMEECIDMLNDQIRVQNMLLIVDQHQDPQVLQALCQVCHNLLVTHKYAIHKYKLLYMLAFKPLFLRQLWMTILTISQKSLFGNPTPLLHLLSKGLPLSDEETQRLVPLLAVFCSLFSLLIGTLHDTEFYMDNAPSFQRMPFSLAELPSLSLQLKEVCLGLVELAYPDSRPSVRDNYKSAVGSHEQSTPSNSTHLWSHLFKSAVGLLRHFHSRDNRRSFCPEGHWVSPHVVIPFDKPSDFSLRRQQMRNYRPFHGLRAFTRDQIDEGPPLSTKELRTMTMLRELPFTVSFQHRVLVFQSLVGKDKMDFQGEQTHFVQGPGIHIMVRRAYLYEDAFEKLSPENEPEMRLKMRVQLVNPVGLDEAGVDGGGLFREFLSELLKTAFDPNRGFFRLTNDNLLYPNPNVHVLFDDYNKHYYFIGRMLGKALYENLLVELPFAEFFLSKIVNRGSNVDVHHLASLDPVMYRNLLFLKNYEGDVNELGLDFTVMTDELGEKRTEELKPGGTNIQVTSMNRIEYIHLVADYKLNKQMRAQCAYFKQGLSDVIPLDWLYMFNNKELQVLISGAQIPVDIEDLRHHTNYAGGYALEHPTIQQFWRVVERFSDDQRSQLLKFVTSCSRPPLLGFKELDPPFCIQHAGTQDRLPTASTCMNLLKLPEFPTEEILHEKLIYAIQSGAGFELS